MKPLLSSKSRIDPLSLLFIFLSFFLPFSTMIWKSNVWDESYYILDGYMYLVKGLIWPGIEKSILTSILCALPLFFIPLGLKPDFLVWGEGNSLTNRLLEREFLFHSNISADTIIFLARLPVLLLSILLAVFIYQWAKKYENIQTARFSLLLLVFCPTLTSFGGLAVTDFPLACFGFIWLFATVQYFRHPAWKNALSSGVLLGLTLSIKVSGLLFVIFFGIYAIIFLIQKKLTMTNSSPYHFSTYLLQCLSIPILGFLIAIAWFLPTNIPWGYFHSLDYMRKHMEIGHPTFLWGQYSDKGWWYYYPFAFFIKTPVPLLLLGFLSLLRIYFKKRLINWKNEIPIDFYLWTIIFGWFFISMTNSINLGIRHILPIYPCLVILSGKTISDFWNKYKYDTPIIQSFSSLEFWKYRGIFLILLVWYIFSWLKIYPYDMAYFNEFIGGPKNGYKYLVDSNLDWGQDLKNLKRWMDKNKVDKIYLHYFGNAETEYYGIQRMPRPVKKEDLKGYIAVSVTDLQAVYLENKHVFDWLKQMEPVDHIGYSILIYKLPDSFD